MRATDRDPIVAIATAPGQGGVGIVRLSSGAAELRPVIEALLGAAAPRLAPRHALLASFLAADGHAIDEGLALLFPAPHSYTGETVLELQGHGGPVVLRLLLARVLEAGRAAGVPLRVAEPGEFTRRAFLNGRIDLAQAESVADLIDASTEAAARAAARSLSGEFSVRVRALHDALVDLRLLVEATLDFPEEEIDFLEASDARGKLADIRQRLAQVQQASRQGAVLRAGLAVVLAGSPNVGKSSLMNALAGEEVAIVTAIAGTTRDRIEKTVQVRGIPLNLIDTAGVRDTADEVERLGIARTLDEVARADVVLHLVEAGDARGAAADADVLARVRSRIGRGVPVITVFNKIDLAGLAPRVQGESVWLSARSGAGLEGLREKLLAIAGWGRDTGAESVFLARERHLDALARAAAHLDEAARLAALGDRQLDLFAEELRLAGEALGEITGELSADELLGLIFGRFCIGK
ncbi:MAG TPA: tRNA uridine-5-carboxymethylaminomethyl(34) synthesis GTPase MnmE [Burkholderiaceae bacterium]|nr:tRNA uridine-5-carboxymethylaminomethyl(34) synthesis GTPase MnmE [Burkholderiaceae bacterium]